MNIHKSSARQVRELIADLSAEQPAVRESAIARLMVAGTRAVGSLADVVASPSRPVAAREGALRALDGIGGARALDSALKAAHDPEPDVASTAISVVRAHLRGARGLVVVDRLTAVAFDRARPAAVRLAAVRALCDLPPKTLKPVYEALRDDPVAEIAAVARGALSPSTPSPDASGDDDLDAADLPDDPSRLRQRLSSSTTSLSALHRLLERIREREAAEPADKRVPWTTARGAVHAALANRNSRLALYDLRETLERTKEPLPVDFLAALEKVGDASCLEPIAEAYARASVSGGDEWWQRHLSSAFRTIASRERITRRHAIMKKVEKRWPSILSR